MNIHEHMSTSPRATLPREFVRDAARVPGGIADGLHSWTRVTP